jgi:hypothetical protein
MSGASLVWQKVTQRKRFRDVRRLKERSKVSDDGQRNAWKANNKKAEEFF